MISQRLQWKGYLTSTYLNSYILESKSNIEINTQSLKKCNTLDDSDVWPFMIH